MNHENAPATKLLATACACCGRALVDAVSVETGIGPDCREKFGVAADATNRDEANALVHEVAKKGVSKSDCRAICAKLRDIGFEALAARIMKRFRMQLAPAADVAACRAEYRAILADMTYDNVTAKEFNALVIAAGANTPESFVAIAKNMTCTCGRCAGTGNYITRVENGVPRGPGGECYRCQGKGYQTREDAVRNRVFDLHYMARALRATG